MVNIIAEIGINHNGDLNIAKKLIDVAAIAGCDYVKFQKRTPKLCVPESQKNKIKETPWGEITYLEYKEKIEFNLEDYIQIDHYCKEKGIKWFASAWDIESAHFLMQFNTDLIKIPSAHLTSHILLEYCRTNFDKVILSTGMSTEKEIEEAIFIGKPDILFHTNSVYPSPINELNMGYITWLRDHFPKKSIGFSNHCYGIIPAIASVYLGVEWIEAHITLDHDIWGSDQLSSIQPAGLFKLTKGIRDLEKALKGYRARKLYPGEEIKQNSLRIK